MVYGLGAMGSAITYNPYKYSTFVHLYGQHPIKSARIAALTTVDKVGKIMVCN
jgi:hypothetical protein